VNPDSTPKVMRIRPTVAAIQEPMDNPHYFPKDPQNLLKADPDRP
jgi:hypothetical protein